LGSIKVLRSEAGADAPAAAATGGPAAAAAAVNVAEEGLLSISRLAGFVPQFDLLHESLTVSVGSRRWFVI
jgi:hypothetical protein